MFWSDFFIFIFLKLEESTKTRNSHTSLPRLSDSAKLPPAKSLGETKFRLGIKAINSLESNKISRNKTKCYKQSTSKLV